MDKTKARRIVLLILLTATLCIRTIPGAGEWYARHLYPTISAALSWLGSCVTFSLDEIVVIAGVLLLILYPIFARRRWHSKARHIVLTELEIGVAFYVWFNLGWACNYSRSNVYQRLQVRPVQADTLQFCRFLDAYTDSLNASYVRIRGIDKPAIVEDIKQLYRDEIPAEAALCTPHHWQRPKRCNVNALYSSNGTLGYMGPFFAESQLNNRLLDMQYPFTYAHELSHLLGVSNEAEANYWAYYICIRSQRPEVRYCGYFGLLGYVANNAGQFLTEKEIRAWVARINPAILAQYRWMATFWQLQHSSLITAFHQRFYDWFLRSNGIPSGHANYNQVIEIVMSAEVK